MREPSGAGRKALLLYAALLKLYPPAYRRAFGAQMRQTFQDQYIDIATQGGRAGIQFWLGVAGDEAVSILHEHFSDLRKELDSMNSMRRNHTRLWAIGIGIALLFVFAVVMRPGVLKVSLAVSALAILGSIPVLLIVSGYARVKHLQTPLESIAARGRVPVGIVLGGMAAGAILALFVVSKANQPVVACGSAAGGSAAIPPAALTTAQDFSAQGDYDYARGECDKAIADYSRAIELNADFASAYNNRAYTHMVQKEYAAALPDLDRAILLRPDYVNALMNRGDIYNYYQVDYGRAIADYERVLALGPAAYQQTPVCNHLAIARNRGQLPVMWVGAFAGGGDCTR